MRGRLGVVALTVVLLGCSGGSDEAAPVATDAAPVPVTEAQAGASDAVVESIAEDGDGDTTEASAVDCAFIIDEANGQDLVGLQLMPQMTSADTIESVKTGVLQFSPDKLLTYLEALRPLGGRDYEVFGDPADEIEHYIQSTNAAQELLAIEGPVPQDQIDAYLAIVGDPSKFIMGQAAIGAAIDENCR